MNTFLKLRGSVFNLPRF